MIFEPWQLIILLIIGLVSGCLGGLLGVGGSIIMIPALVFVFGQGLKETPEYNQHLYQAAAMIVNVCVVIPATFRHYVARAMIRRVILTMLPAAIFAIILGVMLSNLPFFQGPNGAIWLGRLLGLFLIYVIFVNLRRLIHEHRNKNEKLENVTATIPRGIASGGTMGLLAGLMGIGGGAIAVPLQQTLMRIPLRNAIANSTLIIVFTAAIGACLKNATLAQHDIPWQTSLILAGCLAPTAMIGGYYGARLTHTLPIRSVRIVFIVFMTIAALRMWAVI